MIHFELAFVYGTGFGLSVFSGGRVTDEYSIPTGEGERGE